MTERNGQGQILVPIDFIMKIIVGISVLVIATGIIGGINMGGLLIRIDERTINIDKRLVKIEKVYRLGTHQ